MEAELKVKVYVETTVFSLIVARPSKLPLMAERQDQTRDWWNTDANAFDLYTSDAVRTEAARGDAEMAKNRLELIDSIKLLRETDAMTKLGQGLIRRGILPEKAAVDAIHLAIATMAEIDVLVTWNCVHLANGSVMTHVRRLWEPLGYNVPQVLTPEQLPGVNL